MTRVSVHGEKWLIDDAPTYKGITYQGINIEGLLLNARMVNAIFDDDNIHTRHIWIYPDTTEWDPNRNTNEFISMLPNYKRYG